MATPDAPEGGERCPFGDGTGSLMSSEQVVAAVAEMQAFRGTEEQRRRHFLAARAAFRDACPTLFGMACRPGLDMAMVRYMLSARDRLGAGEENSWRADEAVGRRLADKYLAGVRGGPAGAAPAAAPAGGAAGRERAGPKP